MSLTNYHSSAHEPQERVEEVVINDEHYSSVNDAYE